MFYFQNDKNESNDPKGPENIICTVIIMHLTPNPLRWDMYAGQVCDTMYENRRAELKVKIVTGACILQANSVCFNQYIVDPTCKVYQKEQEDRMHFIAKGESLDHVIEPYQNRLEDMFIDTIVNILIV